MKTRLMIVATVLAAFGVAHEEPKGKTVTVTGTVVDTGCYMTHDAKGEKHVDCATTCAKSGVPLAIVDNAGKLYLPVATDHKNQNAKLMPFIEKTVKVTGTTMDKGGIHGIALKTVELAQ
jgi:type 1 fimbria pilin